MKTGGAAQRWKRRRNAGTGGATLKPAAQRWSRRRNAGAGRAPQKWAFLRKSRRRRAGGRGSCEIAASPRRRAGLLRKSPRLRAEGRGSCKNRRVSAQKGRAPAENRRVSAQKGRAPAKIAASPRRREGLLRKIAASPRTRVGFLRKSPRLRAEGRGSCGKSRHRCGERGRSEKIGVGTRKQTPSEPRVERTARSACGSRSKRGPQVGRPLGTARGLAQSARRAPRALCRRGHAARLCGAAAASSRATPWGDRGAKTPCACARGRQDRLRRCTPSAARCSAREAFLRLVGRGSSLRRSTWIVVHARASARQPRRGRGRKRNESSRSRYRKCAGLSRRG